MPLYYQLAILILTTFLFTAVLAAPSNQNDQQDQDSEPVLVHKGCKDFGKCCSGRDSTCFVANVVKEELKNCYCDAECAITGDCCHDHKEFCKPVDCEVSGWEDWTTCSKLCGHGNQTRTRTITQESENGGASCPVLSQMRQCIGEDCNIKRDVRRRALKETGRILPIRYATYRTSMKYDIRRGIRKNLYDYYHSANSILSKPTYCAFYKISYARPHCRRPLYGEWAKTLKRGLRMCVECQSSAMHQNGHCKGDGVMGRDTRWKAVGVSACSGWWRLDSTPRECSCNSRKEQSFIFV